MWNFHHKGDKPKPLVRIQKWVSDWINECMHNQRKIFLFCYYTDSDLDNDWQNKASMCIGEALHVVQVAIPAAEPTDVPCRCEEAWASSYRRGKNSG